MQSPRRSLSTLAAACLGFCLPSQDNILIYGNSIIDGPTPDYLSDLVVESGAPAPNIVRFIIGNGTTSNYVGAQGLITNSLASGQDWTAMIVQGGTVETTPNLGNPAAFHNNMLTLANVFFGHSPQGLFVGHETGADHPNSSRYPAWFPDAATWLSYPQAAYARAADAINVAHPTSPPVRTARQGTCWASTAGYPLVLYRNDLHHLTAQGEALCACLYFIEIYGGRIEDLGVDYAVPTPLVNRLMADGISEAQWERLVGFADRSQPRSVRPYPGSDSDFQLRVGVNTSITTLTSTKSAVAGDSLFVRLTSPLDSTELYPAGVYFQWLPTGTPPTLGNIPGLQLDRTLLGVYFAVPDLTGGPVVQSVPTGMSGSNLWLQATSRAPTGSTGFPLMLSDAQVIEVQ